MKRKFRTRISCLLIASLCIGLLSATALAADPPAGTVEDPTVTKTVTTDTKQDTPRPRPDHDDHDNGEGVEGDDHGSRNNNDGKRRGKDDGYHCHRPGRRPARPDRHRRGQRDHDHHAGRGRSAREAGHNGCRGQQAGWQRGSDRGAGKEYK